MSMLVQITSPPSEAWFPPLCSLKSCKHFGIRNIAVPLHPDTTHFRITKIAEDHIRVQIVYFQKIIQPSNGKVFYGDHVGSVEINIPDLVKSCKDQGVKEDQSPPEELGNRILKEIGDTVKKWCTDEPQYSSLDSEEDLEKPFRDCGFKVLN